MTPTVSSGVVTRENGAGPPFRWWFYARVVGGSGFNRAGWAWTQREADEELAKAQVAFDVWRRAA